MSWRDKTRQKLAQRALERQLAYQQRKAEHVRGREDEIISAMKRSSQRVRELLETFQPISPDARVIEVGSGAHGLIFYFGSEQGVGVDPLAVSYGNLFPRWQQCARTVAACGESLPFADQSFDVVLCDNVVDHAVSPKRIVAELTRVLAPGGLLYFTVNVHHPVYAVAAGVHSSWRAMGIPYEVGPFADHTIHLTLPAAASLFENLPLQILSSKSNIDEARSRARKQPPRHVGDRFKRVFFKNALYEVVARRV
ncbi:MAG TPA: methyltransferase domain-containing protein [Pyrinomonadaceae bacterium]|jgi:SAM-dependent methyltransferase|nr:methyltransferase domain-containing protein [Pyrinomonadaceae bacterium]